MPDRAVRSGDQNGVLIASQDRPIFANTVNRIRRANESPGSSAVTGPRPALRPGRHQAGDHPRSATPRSGWLQQSVQGVTQYRAGPDSFAAPLPTDGEGVSPRPRRRTDSLRPFDYAFLARGGHPARLLPPALNIQESV